VIGEEQRNVFLAAFRFRAFLHALAFRGEANTERRIATGRDGREDVAGGLCRREDGAA
jgi:hypothetical protein